MNKTQPSTEWTVTVVAGTGAQGYSGDGSLAPEPTEQSVRLIRRIRHSGSWIVTTIAVQG